MNNTALSEPKIHGRLYNKPFYIIKHEFGEIYKIDDHLLKIFNEREKYVLSRQHNMFPEEENQYVLLSRDKEWQKYIEWEKNIQEPIVISAEPSDIYFMSYYIVNDEKEKYIRHKY